MNKTKTGFVIAAIGGTVATIIANGITKKLVLNNFPDIKKKYELNLEKIKNLKETRKKAGLKLSEEDKEQIKHMKQLNKQLAKKAFYDVITLQ